MIDTCTLEEYRKYCNDEGEFDEINIKLAYKLYVALCFGTAEELKKVENDCFWNLLFRKDKRFN